jgi:hypothetical protein
VFRLIFSRPQRLQICIVTSCLVLFRIGQVERNQRPYVIYVPTGLRPVFPVHARTPERFKVDPKFGNCTSEIFDCGSNLRKTASFERCIETTAKDTSDSKARVILISPFLTLSARLPVSFLVLLHPSFNRRFHFFGIGLAPSSILCSNSLSVAQILDPANLFSTKPAPRNQPVVRPSSLAELRSRLVQFTLGADLQICVDFRQSETPEVESGSPGWLQTPALYR